MFIHTVTVLAVLALAIVCEGLFLLAHEVRGGKRYVRAGVAYVTCGTGWALLGLRDVVPAWISSTFGAMLVILGLGVFREAVRRRIGLRPQPFVLVAGPLIWVLANISPAVSASRNMGRWPNRSAASR